MEKKIRAYFDYNVYDILLRDFWEYQENKNIDIFYSVAHVEEYFKAK